MTVKETIKRKKSDRTSIIAVKQIDKSFLIPMLYHGPAHLNSICDSDGYILFEKTRHHPQAS